MALITSAATGNFSAGATWTGGVVPTVGDEARASTGHTITIDVNTTCDEVSNDGTGIFTLADGVTLTANVTHKSTTANRNVVQFFAASPAAGFIVGDITGGTVAAIAGAVILSSTGTLTVTGNVTGGSGTTAHAAQNGSTGTLTITGNVTGGSGVTASGVNNQSSGTLNVTGIATGGTTNGASGVRGGGGVGTINLTRAKGNDFGSGSTAIAAGFGAEILQAHILKVKEIEYGLRGMSPTSGPVFIEADIANIALFQEHPSGSKTLSDPNNTAGLSPAVTDVRTGVTYNNGNETGTCAVPAAGSVALGVPVDATTGTAVLTPAAIWDALTSGMTATGSIGERLKNASTLDSTGQQLADALSP